VARRKKKRLFKANKLRLYHEQYEPVLTDVFGLLVGIAGLVLTRVLKPQIPNAIATKSHHHDDVTHHVIFIIGALLTAFGW